MSTIRGNCDIRSRRLFFLTAILCAAAGCFDSAGPLPGVSDLDGIQGAASRFLRAVEANLLEEAHDATTEAFRARMNREAFAQFIGDNPALRRRHQLVGLHVDRSTMLCHYDFAVQSEAGKEQRFQLVLRQEEAEWKVDSLNKTALHGTNEVD